MRYLILFILITGCTVTPTTIERTYTITIYAAEGSTVMFTPEIMADVIKQKEVDIEAEANADIEAKIPISP